MSARKTNVLKTRDHTWEYEASAKDDKAKSRLKYKDDFTGWASRCPKFYSAHPDIPGMQLVDIKAKKQEGDQIEVDLFYEVMDWTAEYPGRTPGERATERFFMDPSLSDEPLFTFHKFADISDEMKSALRDYQASDRTNADYNTCNGIVGGDENAFSFLNAMADGQEAWRAPRVVWVRKRSVKNLNEIDFDLIGKIDDPPQDKDSNPNTPEGYSWMYLPPIVTPSADGQTYDVEERWERSDEGGWNTFFYEAPATP